MISGFVSMVVGLFTVAVGIILGIAVPLVICILVPLVFLAVPLLLVMAFVWLLGLGSKKSHRRDTPDDVRMMQEINRGLARMDNRLNSLETILFDDESHRYSTR